MQIYNNYVGQAGAIRVGLSRALTSFTDVPIGLLEKNNLLIIDSRNVERKKPGQKKARKKFSWYGSVDSERASERRKQEIEISNI